jgi:N-acetylmuramic acid 6-phosphate etherase
VSEVEYLGIEGGGTRTVGLVVSSDGEIRARAEFGPGNPRLLTDNALRELLLQIARFCPAPKALGAGLAGVRDEMDRRRVLGAIRCVWGETPALVTHDLAVALGAAQASPEVAGKVLVLSGTGSCCYGTAGSQTAKVGGWGHLLGDVASGYAIAYGALREVIYQLDRFGQWTPLGKRFLEALLLNEPNDLIMWIQSASKAEVAALARCVFETKGDPIARRTIHDAAAALALDAIICARRLSSKTKPILFVLAGGVLLKQPVFARRVGALIRRGWPLAKVTTLEREGAWGAAEMARQAAKGASASIRGGRVSKAPENAHYLPEFIPGSAPTEQRNPESIRFHELSTPKMVELMMKTEEKVVPALRREQAAIVRAVEIAAKTLKSGGRIFYVGAGTSGRLGVLDASECPPTFRVSPEIIQGIIAGGQRALWQAVEGAEDDAGAGARALRFREVQRRDLVIGIAASGRTPFVWGALGFAKEIRAKTILLCFNPSLEIEKRHRPDLVIAANLGPEILTGSTRLKSGTATKLVLNMISTISMVRIGKVVGNLMVDLNPSNIKLRDRAVRIVRELTGCTAERARAALERNQWVVKEAWAEVRMNRAK